jgi:predicted  nucleic acid-binding Zn-ribbon protein
VKIKFYINLSLFILFTSSLLAQSDFRITQEFKSRQRSFEIAIEYAKSVDELEKIKKEISAFKSEFKGNKELLNRALYPSNFESSFESLGKKIEFTNKKLTEITSLQSEVSRVTLDFEKVSDELKKMSGEVFTLKKSNTQLMAQLRAFQSGYGGSKEAIDSLNNLVSQLKTGISRRDTLIKEILDNIFSTAEHKIESLNDAEKKTLKTKIQGTSLIDNIENLINDNIAFLDASFFTSEDLSVLRDEFNEFEQRWTHFGPKLFGIYSSDKQNQEKLSNIDTLITDWQNSLSSSIWKSVKDVFSQNNILLEDFNSGSEFEDAVSKYIDNEINSDGIEVKRNQNYVFFADKAWKENFKPNWMPLLISSNLINIEQISTIEDKILEWKEYSGSSKSYFIYGVILLLAVAIIISIILVMKKKAKNRESSADDNNDIVNEKDEKFE